VRSGNHWPNFACPRAGAGLTFVRARPASPVRAGRMQAEERRTLSGLLEKDSILEVVVSQLKVAANDRLEAHAAPTSRITFITRCSARACCIATSESPSSTKPGTRISIANTS